VKWTTWYYRFRTDLPNQMP